MFKKVIFASLLIPIFFISGCGFLSGRSPEETQKPPPMTPFPEERAVQIKYSTLDSTETNNVLHNMKIVGSGRIAQYYIVASSNWQNYYAEYPGINLKDNIFIAAFRGQMGGSGFRIEVSSINYLESQKNLIKIIVTFINPPPGPVPLVVTSPFTIVTLVKADLPGKGEFTFIFVDDKDGKELATTTVEID